LDRQIIYLLILTVLGFVITYCLVPITRRLAIAYGFVAKPGVRRIHSDPIPVLGGCAIFAPQILLFLGFIYLAVSDSLSVSATEITKFVSLFLAASWIFVLGLMDDRVNLGWKKKLVGQIVGVCILILGGNTIGSVDIPFFGPVDFGPFGYPLLGLVVLLVTNAVNLIDGMDGLAGGVCLFAAITCGVFAVYRSDLLVASIAFTITGSLLAFLRYNFPPASIFMGDSGSLSLGFILSALATSNIVKAPGQRYATLTTMLALLLPFAIALIDVFLAIARRWISGRKIFLPDSDHIHHRFIEMFKRPRIVVGIFYFFSILFCSMTLLITMLPASPVSSIVVGISILMLLLTMTAVFKLYRIDTLANVLRNRPDFKFLSAFNSYMELRIRRAKCADEVVQLLEHGVRDLDFDSVEVRCNGSRPYSWNKPEKAHPCSARINGHKSFRDCDFIICWTVPTHDDRAYQKYLEIVWHRFLNQVEDRNAALTQEKTRNPA
jgi:UDP-GlcNAc:undecaprenyl-phosphate/decaprenyl-phosphate GlcNAc-1-phosphate transferase